MVGVRVLVGTRKGAFVLTSDEARQEWDVSGPHFAGWEVMDVTASPLSPDRLYAAPWTDWHGPVVQRSDDGGLTWSPVGNDFVYDGDPGTHQWYDGTLRPWEFSKIWQLFPSPFDADTVFAGAHDAALFRSVDGGDSWSELPGLRDADGPNWQPGAGGLCLHTLLFDPRDSDRMYVAISAAGVFRTLDGGSTWAPANAGLLSDGIPSPAAEVGHCVHNLTLHPSAPDTIFMQKHWDVMRSDDGADSWTEISGNLPTDFGFPIAVHAHEPETVYVVPITSDLNHFPPDGRLRVYRSRSGGSDWEPLTEGLPQENCYVNVLRNAFSVDSLSACGLYFGTTGGQVYASTDDGDSWSAIVRDLPPVYSVEAQTLS